VQLRKEGRPSATESRGSSILDNTDTRLPSKSTHLSSLNRFCIGVADKVECDSAPVKLMPCAAQSARAT